MSGLEIERKFLVRKDAKWKEQATSVVISFSNS